MPKEPRQRDSRGSKKSGDTVTRNIVIGMVALVVLSGVIFTVLDKRSGSETALPASIESIDSSQNGAPSRVQYSQKTIMGLHSMSTRHYQSTSGKTSNAPSASSLKMRWMNTLKDL